MMYKAAQKNSSIFRATHGNRKNVIFKYVLRFVSCSLMYLLCFIREALCKYIENIRKCFILSVSNFYLFFYWLESIYSKSGVNGT